MVYLSHVNSFPRDTIALQKQFECSLFNLRHKIIDNFNSLSLLLKSDFSWSSWPPKELVEDKLSNATRILPSSLRLFVFDD